jgi:hypothetical protein
MSLDPNPAKVNKRDLSVLKAPGPSDCIVTGFKDVPCLHEHDLKKRQLRRSRPPETPE